MVALLAMLSEGSARRRERTGGIVLELLNRCWWGGGGCVETNSHALILPCFSAGRRVALVVVGLVGVSVGGR